MKLVSLRTELRHQQDKFDKSSPATIEHFSKSISVTHQIHTYAELRQQIHEDLRRQHPEWVQPNGESPICDSYEARLTELLNMVTQKKSDEPIGAPPDVLEHGRNRINIAAAAAY